MSEGLRRSVPSRHYSRPEVDGAGHRLVNAAQVQHQFIIDIEPEIVVSGEFEDDVMSPGVKSVRGLGEVRGHLHTEEIVCLRARDLVKSFSVARIIFRKRGSRNRRLISIHVRIRPRLAGLRIDQAVVGHELTVVHRNFVFRSLHSSQLVVDLELTAVKISKVFSRVIFKIAALVVDALYEQVIYFLISTKEAGQGTSLYSSIRVAVRLDIRRQKARAVAVSSKILCLD